MNHDGLVKIKKNESHVQCNQYVAKLETSFSSFFTRTTMMGYCTVSPCCLKENGLAIKEKYAVCSSESVAGCYVQGAETGGYF